MDHIEVLETPDKSETDKKSYRVIRLPNGLKALLISDPTAETKENTTTAGSENQDTATIVPNTIEDENSEDEESDNDDDDESGGNSPKLAACAFCIDVGSFSDPRDVQGLAHFLEHMIFMGSEKYPTENEFDRYLQKAGGFANATTGFDDTIFYFDIREEYLDGALDRFSQLFKSPLMLKEAMTREREAVESEFLLKKNDEDNRRGQLLASIGQSTHPSSVFPWGNLQTLKDNIDDETLYQKVHDFRERHYSAHRMYVSLQSRLPLDDLQDLVVKHFENVPNNQLPGDDFSQFNHSNAFESKFYENVYFIKPFWNMTKIDIQWCLEPTIRNFKTKPEDYLAFLLGHEGNGSLLNYLRNKLWAVNLSAGTDESGSNSLFSLFGLHIHLTDDGFDHLEEVLKATFGYIKLLQEAGPNERLFHEIQSIEANSFHFATQNDTLENVEDLVISLKEYPSKYILNGDSLYFEYDSNVIQKFIDEINSRRFNIMITSTRRYDDDVTYESTEPWFGTQYTERRMPDKWIELWENAKPLEEFSLPEPNPFIADDFTLLYDKSSVIPKHPIKIFDKDSCELWFKADNKFLLPTAYFHFYFMIPQTNESSSAESEILRMLLSSLLEHQLAEKLYAAKEAGLGYSSYSSNLGLLFQVSGFNEKLHLVVEVFTKCLKSLADEITEQQFQVFVDERFQLYENVFLSPNVLSFQIRSSIIETNHSPLFEINKLLRSIKFTDLQQYCGNFCKQMRIKALMQGNITESHAKTVMERVLDDLDCDKIEDLSAIDLRATKIPIGSYYLRCSTFHSTDVNTSVLNLYQIGPTSFRTHVLIDLLMLIVQEPLFDTLRTKEQLTYSLSSYLYDDFGILSYLISVDSQENKHSAEYVDERIENFRRDLLSIIAEMPDEDFEAFKATLAKRKLQVDNKLWDEVSRNWKEIKEDEYEFDRANKEVECLTMISKTDFLEFYQSHFGENERKLSVQVIGNSSGNGCENSNAAGDENSSTRSEDKETRRKRFDTLNYVNFREPNSGHFISDLVEFKKTLEIYPVTKTNRRFV